MTDLISRDTLLEQLRANHAWPSSIAAVEAAPVITPRVVANITGGILQGASSDYPVAVIALDFDTDSFDHNAIGVQVDGTVAYRMEDDVAIDPGFVDHVQAAELVYLHNLEPVKCVISTPPTVPASSVRSRPCRALPSSPRIAPKAPAPAVSNFSTPVAPTSFGTIRRRICSMASASSSTKTVGSGSKLNWSCAMTTNFHPLAAVVEGLKTAGISFLLATVFPEFRLWHVLVVFTILQLVQFRVTSE